MVALAANIRQGELAGLAARGGTGTGPIREPGASFGSQRVQACPDGARLSQSVVAGGRLPVRLRRTWIDGPDAHGMQEARGSSPLSSTSRYFARSEAR